MADPDVIFAQMTARASAGQIPSPARRSVSGFPPLTDRVADLPLLEQIDLRMMAEWVIDTHELAGFPVIAIACIGHADRDFQRGKAFEQQISERRANAVKLFFQQEISRLFGFRIFDLMLQPGFIPILARIKFTAEGVGSTQHVPASNEAGRRRNRRITIILERGRSPQPPPPFIVDVTKPPLPLPPPDPGRHPWTRKIPAAIKLPQSDFERRLDRIRKSAIQYFDMGSMAKASFNAIREFIDPTLPGPELEKVKEDLANDLRDWWEDQKRERDVRLKDPPGDDD